MAGITNAAFRRLCREYGAGLYVCEMITTRGAGRARRRRRMRMLGVRRPRSRRASLQLYGIDPVVRRRGGARSCATEDRVDHIDLNFGCPVPKVTRKGGGAALPWKRRLLGEILAAAVAAAGRHDVPVTMKIRKGIDDDHLTYLDAGRIAAGRRRAPRSRCTAAPPPSATPARPTGTRSRGSKQHVDDPGARQRRHLGGRRRAAR